jgi:hypothetical protein
MLANQPSVSVSGALASSTKKISIAKTSKERLNKPKRRKKVSCFSFGRIAICAVLSVLWATFAAAGTVTVACPKDGITDAAPCIQATIDALTPNSTLLFNGGNYLINSGVLQRGNTFCGVTSAIDGLTLTGLKGAKITSGPAFTSGGALFCPTDTATNYELSTTIGYPIVSATTGMYQLTLVNLTDAANFQVGHVIYIHGETSDYNDRGANVIKDISGATLTLIYPLGKDYPDHPMVADVDAFTRRNLTISHLTWNLNGAYAFTLSEVLNANISHNIFKNFSMFEDIGIGYVIGYRYESNILLEACTGVDVSSRGTNHVVVANNSVKLSGCAATQNITAMAAGEGAENVVFANNIVSVMDGNNEEGIDVTGAHATTIYHNKIHLQHAGSAAGIVLDNGAPAQFVVPSNTFLIDNIILVDSGVCVRIQGGELAGIGNALSAPSGVVMYPAEWPPVWMVGGDLIPVGGPTF